MDDKEEDRNDKIGCSECIRNELKPRRICPTNERTELFIDTQWTWGRISLTYVIYRLIVGCLLIAWVFADFCVEAGRWYSFNYAIWLVFATNWSLLFLCFNCVVMAITTTYYFLRVKCTRHDENDLRVQSNGAGLAIQWVIYNIAANTSVVVSISYWTFVIIIDGSGFMTTSMSQLKHTLNSVYMIVDMFINGVPIRVLHVIYPVTMGLIYAVFNAVYFINNGVGPNGRHYAYYVLDWRYPLGSTITCFLGLVLCACVHLVLYGIYRCRLWFHRKLTSRIDQELEQPVLRRDEYEEDANIFATSRDTPSYRSVDDMELRNG